MADYPDVLDHVGKTPREFGSLHVHLEPVAVDDGWGWAAVWFQAAFEPMDPLSSFELFSGGPAPTLLREAQRVPPLDRGAVMKGLVRFKLADDVAQVVLKVKSAVPKGAERCRPPWKLFDTFEISKESEMRTPASGGINIGASVVASVLAAPAGFAVISFTTGGGDGPSLQQSVHGTMHKAHQLPDGFTVDVLRDAPRPQPAGDAFAPFWAPGQPLPELAPVALPVRPASLTLPPASGRMECNRCGFSGKYADYHTDKYCPQCGHSWG